MVQVLRIIRRYSDFRAKTVAPDIRAIFDAGFYLRRNPDIAASGVEPLAHYLEFGWAEGRDPSPLFGNDYYLDHNPDVAEAGLNPLLHFVGAGAKEGRNPSPLFDVAWYLARSPDVAAAEINPLAHYLTAGAGEGRAPNPLFDAKWYAERARLPEGANPLAHYAETGGAEGLSPHPLFDGRFYLDQNPDVAAAEKNPLAHYLERGAAEPRQPHPLFDAAYYLRENPDVAAAGKNPLIHFIEQGWREGRNPNLLFDIAWYLKKYPDVAKAGINPLAEYVEAGWKEGRNPSEGFDTRYYLEANKDVATSDVNPLTHYLAAGKAEGRASARPAPGNIFADEIRQTDKKKEAGLSLARGPEFARNCFTESHIARLFESVESDEPEFLPVGVLETALKVLRESKSPPQVSVIIPTWNRSSSVCAAILSAIHQYYRPFEIIVSDDGSEDNTVEIIRATFPAETESGWIKIIRNEHKGVSAARNTGLENATGDLIAYLDSDNKWRPEYLLIMCAAFAESEAIHTAYSALKSHNRTSGEVRFRANAYDRRRILKGNFIDLNIFMHRRDLYEQCGGFDENLTRLVDWDLIVRYTKLFPPLYLPFCGADYYLDKEVLNNITFSENLDRNYKRIARKNFQERIRRGVDQLRLAYFVYDFPALSQTFVMNELRWLVRRGYDVKVFYVIEPDRKADLDFEIEAIKVQNAEELAAALSLTERNVCHSHFAYPGVTLFVRPACEIAEVNYTFMPHAVDIFHHNNRDRSRLDLITNDKRCLRAFVYGDHHRKFLESKGALRHKIAYNFQAIEPADFVAADKPPKRSDESIRGIVIARFIEKKGIGDLIDAAALIRDLPVSFAIYGYGPLEEVYKQRIAELGLSNFEFPGAIEGRAALSQAYWDADFLIAPCVEASNGDVDGFPTVIFEAMAAGKPVITTSVSAIPDYLRNGIEAIIAEPRSPKDLAAAIRRLFAMSATEKRALVERARRFLQSKVGIENTIRRFLDVWSGYEVEIFIVTYNTKEYDSRHDTIEIVRRIIDKTTTNYTFTIVDNGSDTDFLNSLKEIIQGRENVRLIKKSRNVYCGPASNLALSYGDSEFAIYVCSKEGFVKDHGWERPLIERMRAAPEMALGGYMTHLPKFTLGKELIQHPEFSMFRNPEFARANPERAFRHIQGGAYIIRRDTLSKHGWFNELLPQNNMDVEYSYYLESEGAVLGELPELRSLSIKTLPKLSTVVDETTVIAHPLSVENVGATLDIASKRDQWRCNLCGALHYEHEQVREDEAAFEHRCSTCKSTSFGRSVGAVVAHDYRTHRGKEAAICASDAGLARFLGDRLFRVGIATSNAAEFAEFLIGHSGSGLTVILDLDLLPQSSRMNLIHRALEASTPDGLIVVGGCSVIEIEADPLFPARLNALRLQMRPFERASRFLSFDWRPIRLIKPCAERVDCGIA